MASFVLIRTLGFSMLDPKIQADIMHVALQKLNLKTDMIVFYPEDKDPMNCLECTSGKPHYEDEGRTYIIPRFKGLKEKVYAKLEDWVSSEVLSEQVGYKTNARVTITFMLAEEY